MQPKLIIIFSFLLAIGCQSNLFAQTSDSAISLHESNRETWFSINAGISFSNTIGKGTVDESFLNGNPPDSYTNSSAGRNFIIGKKFGIGLIKDLNKKFSIGLDVNYEEKGCRIPISNIWYHGTSEAVDEHSNIKLKYIVLPLKLETRFKLIYIESGIYAGILLDADDYGTINGVRFERDKDSRYSLLDIGVLLGIGKRIPLSDNNTIQLGINGNWNITGNDGRSMTPGYDHWYNQSFNLEVRFQRKI